MATVFVEAFGRFLSGGYHPDEDLYSVFRARSVLMGWYTPPQRKPSSLSPVFWRMEEADLCEQNDAPRIATAQVGLEAGVPIVIALPALIQCFDDSLRRFGAVELSGYQVTASGLEAMQESAPFHLLFHLFEMTNYFEVSHRSTEATMIVYELAKGYGLQLATELEKLSTNTFRYQRAAYTPGRDVPSEMSPLLTPERPKVGMTEYLRLSLPEGPDAAGRAMAIALYEILTLRQGTTDARLSLTYDEPDDG
ncbi:MAG: hypothetical protein F4Y44_05975 [Chloroflexi bacterium]|nr:hypothetical protein [Chloroflexota bacterium]